MKHIRSMGAAWAATLWGAAVGCQGDGSTGQPTDMQTQDMQDTAARPDADGEGTPAAFPTELLPENVVSELKPIAPVEGGQAMFTGIVSIKPGDDVTYCTYLEGTTDEVTYIHDTRGTQSRYGHHLVLYYAPEPEEPGTRPCGDMEKYRQILGGSGGESSDELALPGNVVSEIPAGVQFVMNHHWINYGEEATDVQAMLVTVPPSGDDDLVVARSMAIVALGWQLEPGTVTEHVAECEFDQDVPAISILGHEHEWGTWVKAERIAPDGSTDILFDHAFRPEYANNPERFYFPLEAPLMFRKGDTLRFTCEWNNDTSSVIEYPREMCVLFGHTLLDTDLVCANGNWIEMP